MSALLDLIKLSAARAGIGGAAGAGTGAAVSEGDPMATATGGVFGALAGLGGHGLYESAGTLARLAKLARNSRSRAKGMVLSSMEADEIPIDEMRRRVTTSRPTTPLMTSGGANMLERAEMMALQPKSAARNLANEFYEEFVDTQEERVIKEVQDTLGQSPEELSTIKGLQSSKERAAKPLYEEAYKMTSINDPELNELLRRADDLGAFKHMEEIMTADVNAPQTMPIKMVDPDTGETAYTLDTQHADLIKRGLDQVINAHTDQLTGRKDEVGRAYTVLKKAIMGRIDELNPKYAEARKAWSDPTQSQQAVVMGRKFISASIDDLDNWLDKFNDLDEGDKNFFRVGVAQAIKNKMLSGQEGEDVVKKFFKNRGTRLKLQEVFSDPDKFQKFAKAMDEEMKIARGLGKIRGGSDTARRQIAQSETAAEDLDILGDAVSALGGNPLGIIKSLMTRMKTAGIGPKTAKEVMQMLLSTDKAGNLALLDELRRLQMVRRGLHRTNRGAGAAISGGLGAAAGASEGMNVPAAEPVPEDPSVNPFFGLGEGFYPESKYGSEMGIRG